MSQPVDGNPQAPKPPEATTVQVVYDGLTVQLVAAPLVKRAAAYLVDLGTTFLLINLGFLALAIVGALGFFLFALFKAMMNRSGDGSGSVQIVGVIAAIIFGILAMVLLFGIYHGYFIYYEFKKGQTPGKKIFGLKVISTRSGRLTMGQCVLRDFFRYVDCLLIFPGLISVTVSQMRQRLGDFACSTVVIYSAQQERAQQFQYVRPDDYLYLRDLLSPTAVGDDVAYRFLQFAFPAFILKDGASTDARQTWLASVGSYFPAMASLPNPIDGDVLLRFFAEICHRSLSGQKDS